MEIPRIEEIEHAEETASTEEVEQMDLFDTVNDMEDIHREIAGIIGEDALWTDAIHIINDEEMDPEYTLILPESDEDTTEKVEEEEIVETEDEPVVGEPETEEPAEEEDEDALLLQSLRRAFSVEFDTFDPKKSSAKTPAADEDTSEFDFVENEAPKKRGFLSRLIGGDD